MGLLHQAPLNKEKENYLSAMPSEKCPVCGSPADHVRSEPYERVRCERCGRFDITYEGRLGWPVNRLSLRQIANASSWIREREGVRLKSYDLDQLQTIPTPGVAERADKLLLFLSHKYPIVGTEFPVGDIYGNKEAVARTWSLNSGEVRYLLDDYLYGPKKLVLRSGGHARVSSDGWAYLDQLNQASPKSLLGFCAMWFDPETEALWKKGLAPGIENAGYQPFRIDKHEHVNKIDDEIVASIRRSKFVVADFTYGSSGVRGGVYFEAGFALAFGLKVVWTCRKDLIHPEKIHFDVNHYNFLEWEPDDLEDFRDRLTARIEAIFGHGSHKTDSPS